MNETLKPKVVSVEEKRPPPAIRVTVVGKDYRCLGYIDRDGIWRDDAHRKELHDVIGWLDFSRPGNSVEIRAP